MEDRPDSEHTSTGSSPGPDHNSSGKSFPMRGDFASVLLKFVSDVDSLASALPLTMKAIYSSRRKSRAEYRDFVSTKAESIAEDGTCQLDIDNLLPLQKLLRNCGRTNRASTIVPESFLVALVSQYDNFLGLLIEALLIAKPEILNASEKSLSFSELVSFPSLEAARGYVMEREVEAVLRKSHSEQFEWMESTFKIKLRESLAAWPNFIEVTERRNLFVHTGGHVSAQYLKVCRLHKVECGDVVRGGKLQVTPKYFEDAYSSIFEIGVKLVHVFWRKIRPEDRMKADENLTRISYDLLAEEKYTLAKTILDFATEVLKTHSSEECRLRFVINRAQAYKWSGDKARALQILGGVDFSALRNDFKLADAVLREDYQLALALVRSIGSSGAIKLGDYREWPLFRDLRGLDEFQSLILRVFGEPLGHVSLAVENSRMEDLASVAETNDDPSSS